MKLLLPKKSYLWSILQFNPILWTQNGQYNYLWNNFNHNISDSCTNFIGNCTVHTSHHQNDPHIGKNKFETKNWRVKKDRVCLFSTVFVYLLTLVVVGMVVVAVVTTGVVVLVLRVVVVLSFSLKSSSVVTSAMIRLLVYEPLRLNRLSEFSFSSLCRMHGG